VDAGYTCEKVMTTPEFFQLLLRKSVAVCDDELVESWKSVLDGDRMMDIVAWDHHQDQIDVYRGHVLTDRVLAWSQGFFLVSDADPLSGKIVSDMRFGRLLGWNETGSSLSHFAFRVMDDDVSSASSFGGRVFPENFWGRWWERVWGG